jgi:SPP1 gp7 family putative phage head morphogenesis protein
LNLLPALRSTLTREGLRGIARKIWNGYGGEYFNRIGGGGQQQGSCLPEPYRQSVWIQRAIGIKANEIAMAPLKFYQGDNEYDDEKLMAFWEAPAIGVEQRRIHLHEVEQALIGWLDLKGSAVMVLDDAWLLPFQDPAKSTPFIIVKPERIRRVFFNRQIVGYTYQDGAGKLWNLLPEQVIIEQNWNPYADPFSTCLQGLAPVEAVMNAAEADYLAGLYVKNLMRNNGDQGVYVINKDGIPDDKQQEQIVMALREKRAAAFSGDFKPVFLGGDITIEDAKVAQPDLAFQTARVQNRHEIFIGLGVPPSMADVIASYSIGSASDRYALISSTCMPLGKKITAPFGLLASKQTGTRLMAELDWDDNPVMQDVRRGRIDAATKLWAMGMPMEEINEYLDLGMEEFPGWEVGYLPFSVSPVSAGELPEPTTPSPANEIDDEEEDPVQDSIRKLRDMVQRRAKCGQHPSVRQSEKDIALWRKHEASRRQGEKVTHSAISKDLMAARAEVLANIARMPEPAPAPGKSAISEGLNFNVEKFAKDFAKSMEKSIRFNLEKAAVEFVEQLPGDNPWELPDARTSVYLAEREPLLVGVPDEIHEQIQRQLDEGMAAGESKGELSARIRAEFNTINKGRADVIAQTETGGAYSFARNEGMKDTGVRLKRWLASPDDSTRMEHAIADGQTVRVDKPFEVGGEKLMFPGDSSLGASPGNTINCRCVSIPAFDDDEKAAAPSRFKAALVRTAIAASSLNGSHP